ncbi:hypothetical protein [Novispirillum itersonii]|uniref:Uncharacterized protein n=1 Tax=Novispirillum itersonii TaxID=189 RepID=A0A7X0DNT6_NOVIT|nr:hypothetical protein [Novispirillum itersonii]MBB6212493.1 hypothetical protein [Novispirillum itersonii]
MTNPLFDTQTDLEALIAADREREAMAVAARIIDRAADTAPVAVDPDIAEAMGAFEDDALSPEDALDACFNPYGDNDGEDGSHG